MEFARTKILWYGTAVAGALFCLWLPMRAQAAAPTVTSFTPASGVGGVSVNTDLTIVFNQTVIASGSTLGTPSRIRIFRSDGSLIENITASGSQVSVSTATATINPSVTLAKGTTYYIQVETHAFVNESDESYAGISDTTTWTFTTIGGGAAQHRRRLEELRNSGDTHYDMEAPSLSDVGIFISTPGENAAVPADTSKLEKSTEADQSAIDRERQERLARLTELADRAAASEVRQEYTSPLHERACQRVEKHFRSNQKMIDRVNARLQKRFGFTCNA